MKKQLFYLLRLGLALGGMIFFVYVNINYLPRFESMVRADTPPRDSQSNLIKNIQIDEVVAEGFTRPVQVTHAGDGPGRLFVMEQGGKIKIIQDGQVLMRPFLDIQETVNDGGPEQGLLGLTFHPHYTQTGYFYVDYTDAAEFSGKVRRLTAEDVSTATFAPNVIYDVVFESTWRAETHPNNFPAGAHLSGLVGAVHRDSVTFWQRDKLASAGIESMAETGGKSILLGEVDQAIAQGHALGRLSGGGIGSSPGSVTLSSFTLNHNFPLVTLVSMIAPSPDWFVGVSGLSLVDKQGAWIPEMSVQLYPYDSGTDSGTNYTSGNADTNPPEPIRRISGEAPFSEAPIGTLTFALQVLPNKAPNAPHHPTPQDGSEAVSISPTLSWQSDDPDQDDLTYAIALDTKQPPALIATGLMTPSYQADNLQANMTYYWQVTATDGLSITVGPIWVFTTVTTTTLTATVDPTMDRLITSTDEAVGLNFPQNVFSETFEISFVTTSNQPTNTLGNLMFAGYVFDIIAQDLQGQVITQFNRLFTLTLNYQQVDWRATGIVNEAALDVYWWDGQHWIALPSQHDPVLDRFIVPLNHLSQFALLAAEERLYLPLFLKSLP